MTNCNDCGKEMDRKYPGICNECSDKSYKEAKMKGCGKTFKVEYSGTGLSATVDCEYCEEGNLCPECSKVKDDNNTKGK